MATLCLRGVWQKKTKNNGFVSYCPRSSPKPISGPKIIISIQFWVPVPNLSLIGWKIKKLRKNLIFDGTSGKLESRNWKWCHIGTMFMTSLIFCCFEKFLAYTVYLPSFIVVRHQLAELTWEGFFAPPPSIGVSWIPFKIGLKDASISKNIKCGPHSSHSARWIE